MSRFFNKDLELLEPYAAKVARTVLRGGSGSNAADLPDKIFGSEVSKDLIISFLNGVLHEEVIVNITFRNVELLGMKQEQGKVVFDIFCENEKGEIFVVEML